MLKLKFEKIPQLFVKLKFVDYLIILALILGAVLLFKFLNPEKKWIKITVFSPAVSIFQATALHPGDFEKDPSGKQIAEIITLTTYDLPSDPKGGLIAKNLFLKAKILAKINPRSGEFEYKNRVIKIGSPTEFFFNSATLKGIVVDFEGAQPEKAPETRILTLKLYDQWPWFGENLRVGAGEIDERGQSTLEIIEKEVTPAIMTVVTASGETLLRTDPRKVDITLKVKVQVQSFKNELFFQKNTPIKIGEQISFDADKTWVENALITAIK